MILMLSYRHFDGNEDEGEEFMHKVLEKLYEKNIDEAIVVNGSFGAWFKKVAENMFIDEYNHKKTRNYVNIIQSDNGFFDQFCEPESFFSEQDKQDLNDVGIDILTNLEDYLSDSVDRQIFLFRLRNKFQKRKSFKQIEEIFFGLEIKNSKKNHYTEGTIRTRYNRVLPKLRNGVMHRYPNVANLLSKTEQYV